MSKINFKELSSKYFEPALNETINLCKINSIYDPETVDENNPYGKGVTECLEYVKKLGEKYGFESKIFDNRVAELTTGSGVKLISIFAHTDVVPVSGNWTNDPFEPTIRNGKLYCRGSSDDKGPLMEALFATILLKDNNLINNYRIRIVVGGDEERGSSCLEHYFSDPNREIPTYGFTPDCDFPVIYAEKGIANFVSTFDVELPFVKEIKAGVVTNAVIDKCEVFLDKKDAQFIEYLKTNKIEFIEKENELIFVGKSAHGAVPHLGVNAFIICLKAYADFYGILLLKELVDKISDPFGRKFNCHFSKDEGVDTTYNIGLGFYKNGQIEYVTNFRYPENIDVKKFIEKYDENNKTKSVVKSSVGVLYFDKESFLVKTLVDSYQEETGDFDSKPLFIGGGTYAKEAKNTVGFGACFPGENTHMHEPDEFISLDSFKKCISIYANAIYSLGSK